MLVLHTHVCIYAHVPDINKAVNIKYNYRFLFSDTLTFSWISQYKSLCNKIQTTPCSIDTQTHTYIYM